MEANLQVYQRTASKLSDLRVWARSALPFLLIAATPVIFALVTWDTGGESNTIQGNARFLGLPVIGIELIVIFLAMSSGFEPLRVIKSAPSWTQNALLCLGLVAFYTALVVAPRPELALLRTSFWVIHLLFGMALSHLLPRAHPWFYQNLWWLIVSGLLGYALLVALFVAAIPKPLDYEWIYFGLNVVHVRQLGFYSAAGAAAALGLAALHPIGRGYWWAVAAATVMIALSFWSGTRGSIIAVLAALVAAGMLFPALRSRGALVAVVVSFVGGVSMSLLHSPPNPFFGILRIGTSSVASGADAISSGRLTMWSGTWREVLERPLLGYGESQFKYIVPEALGTYSHPHNIVLQMLLQWGFLGSACFFALAAAVVWQMVRSGGRDGANAPAVLAATSLLVMSLYEGSLYHSYPVMIIVLSLAYVTAGQRGRTD